VPPNARFVLELHLPADEKSALLVHLLAHLLVL
jgi:hypothetical protein